MTRRVAPWAVLTVCVYVLLVRASDALAGPYPPSLPSDRPSVPVAPSPPPRLAETGMAVSAWAAVIAAAVLFAVGLLLVVAGGARADKAGRR